MKHLVIPGSARTVTLVVAAAIACTDPAQTAQSIAEPVILSGQCSAPSTTVVGSHTWGALRARVLSSAHVAIDQTDRSGRPFGATTVFDPPAAAFPEGAALAVGVASVQDQSSGLTVGLRMGARTVTVNITSPEDGVVRYEVVNWGGSPPTETTIAAPSDASEHFYGFGEKFNALDQSGNDVDVITSDHPGSKGDNSYKAAPWFVSTRGYGLHLDSTAESFFHMRSLNSSCYQVTNKVGALAFNFSAGPALPDVISHYTSYSGRPPLPPAFAFGPWLSSDVWRDGGEVRFVVQTMRALGIPGSVFVFDSPWEVAYNDFQFNMTQFGAGNSYPTPVVDASGNWSGALTTQLYPGFASLQDMMSFLRSNGYKVVLWLTPIVNTQSIDEGIAGQSTGKASTYDDGVAKNVFVHDSSGNPLLIDWWKGRGSPVDFTSPTARDWLTSQLAALVAQSGGVVGGFKTDDGESHGDASATSDGVYIPPSAQYADGRTGVLMRNGYALEYQRTVWNVLGTTGVILSRGGFAGTQAFPGGWAGDNASTFDAADGLPSVIIAGQSAAMSGYAIWGSDIGGYLDVGPITNPQRSAAEEATVEHLFMRWTQFGALSPIMQLHRQIGSGHQYAWSFGTAALANYRAHGRLHTSLFPYLYAYASKAAATGVPIIRPLVLTDQDDTATFVVRYVYHLGDELLVAPMLADNASRSVTLPPGTWFDFYSGQPHAGGSAITVTPAADQIPLFVRDGAIVPMLLDSPLSLNDASYVGAGGVSTPGGGLRVLVYPSTAGATSQFTMADGTTFSAAQASGATTVTITSAARTIELRIFGVQPASVTRDGAALPELDAATLDMSAEGWALDGQFVRIKVSATGGTTQLSAQ
jgi:alpha-D-xyloside xylohydrolase